MNRRVMLVEDPGGWGIYDALNGDKLFKELKDIDSAIVMARKEAFEAPHRTEKGQFFQDMNGEPLYVTIPSKSGTLELEYADGMPCLDFELCPLCKGPAFGRAIGKHNCYYCQNCEKDVDCVPPAEWIGSLD